MADSSVIKMLIFDLQGVIFTTGDNIRKRFINEGFEEKEVMYAFSTDLKNSLLEQLTIGEIDIEEYKNEVKKLFPEHYDYILKEYFSNRKPLMVSKSFWKENVQDRFNINLDENLFKENNLDMLSIVEELSRHYELCLFTANVKHKIEILEHKYNFLKYFKYKIFTYDVGFDKPSNEIFEYLIENIPYPPKECIYIDDKKVNIQKGEKFGFNTVIANNMDE